MYNNILYTAADLRRKWDFSNTLVQPNIAMATII